MNQRGRKSAASNLGIIQGSAGRRASPPPELTPFEAKLWAKLMRSKPADWFPPETHLLLAAYCRHASIIQTIDEQLDAFQAEWFETDDGLRRYDRLASIRAKQSTSLISLSRSMRLTQQSQVTAKRAASPSTRIPEDAPPWRAD